MRREIYTGEDAYIIIEKNDYCPLRKGANLTQIGPDTVFLNGLIYISSSYAPPYDSYANLIAASPILAGYVINEDTGELRYYDGSQADETEYFDPMHRAVGKLSNFSWDNKYTINTHTSAGSQYTEAIQQLVYEPELNISKAYINKRKLTELSRTSKVWNQLGFWGDRVVEVNDYVDGKIQDYFLVILYIRDSKDATKHRVVIFPCAMFTEIKGRAVVDDFIVCSLKARSTYMRTLEYDDYIPTNVTSLMECAEQWSIAPQGALPCYVGNKLIVATPGFFEQIQTFLVYNYTYTLCGVAPFIENIVGIPTNIYAQIYECPDPNDTSTWIYLGISSELAPGAIVIGDYNFLSISPITLNPVTTYGVRIMAKATPNDDNYYILNFDSTNPQPNGAKWEAMEAGLPIDLVDFVMWAGCDLKIKIHTLQ